MLIPPPERASKAQTQAAGSDFVCQDRWAKSWRKRQSQEVLDNQWVALINPIAFVSRKGRRASRKEQFGSTDDKMPRILILMGQGTAKRLEAQKCLPKRFLRQHVTFPKNFGRVASRHA